MLSPVPDSPLGPCPPGTASGRRAARPCRELAAAELQALLRLHATLEGLLAGRPPPLLARLRAAWLALLPTLLHGAGCDSTVPHLARLEELHGALPHLVGTLATLSDGGALLRQASAPPEQAYCGTLLGLLYLQLFALPTTDPSGSGGEAATGEAALSQLQAAALPPLHFGANPQQAEGLIRSAFAAALALLQSEAAGQRLSQEPGRAARTLPFLARFRSTQPAAAELWWAAFGGVVHGLATMAQERGLAALAAPPLAALRAGLFQDGTAEMAGRYLLAHPGLAGAKDGPRRAFALLAALLAHDTPALLEGCAAAALRPEANQPLAVRLEALQGGWRGRLAECAGAGGVGRSGCISSGRGRNGVVTYVHTVIWQADRLLRAFAISPPLASQPLSQPPPTLHMQP